MKAFKTTIQLLTISSLGNLGLLYAQEDKITPQPTIEKKENSIDQAPLSGTIYFNNEDSISGVITDWNIEKITLNSPDLVEPVSFTNSHILNIILDDKQSSEEANELVDMTSLVIQHRGNQQGLHGVIKGGFSNIDDTHVTLNTSYAGEVKVLKKFVTKMEIDSKKGYLYLGPQNLTEWYSNTLDQHWQYNNQSLISAKTAGNIAQDIKIPDQALISFDLGWKKEERLSLYLYSSDHEQDRPDDYYKVELRAHNRISMYKYASGKRRSDMVSKKAKERRVQLGTNNSLVKDKRNAHYDIYMDKVAGVFHILRNGILIDTFTDSAPKPKSFGSALHLVSSNGIPVRVKNLTLSRWSGNLPGEIDKTAFEKLKGEGQRILLKNGDVLLGQIGKVKEGLMKIETLHTPINLPIIRMRSIDLTANDRKDEPMMYENDIKCWFKNDGWIILKPISITGSKITAYHQALGESEFDLGAFKRIDLNIYSGNSNPAPSPDDW